jgi:hypothetical protein
MSFLLKRKVYFLFAAIFIAAFFIFLILRGFVGTEKMRYGLSQKIVNSIYWIRNKTLPKVTSKDNSDNHIYNIKASEYINKIQLKIALNGTYRKDWKNILIEKSKTDTDILSWLISNNFYSDIAKSYKLSDEQIQKLGLSDLLTIFMSNHDDLPLPEGDIFKKNPELAQKILNRILQSESENGLASSILALKSLTGSNFIERPHAIELLKKSLELNFSLESTNRLELDEKISELIGIKTNEGAFLSASSTMSIFGPYTAQINNFLVDPNNKTSDIGEDGLSLIIKSLDRSNHRFLENNTFTTWSSLTTIKNALQRYVTDFPNSEKIPTLLDEASTSVENAISQLDSYFLMESLPEVMYTLPPEIYSPFKDVASQTSLPQALDWLKAEHPDFINSLESFEHDPQIVSDYEEILTEINKLKVKHKEKKSASNN